MASTLIFQKRHLKPNTLTSIPRINACTRRGLRHVKLHRSRMIHALVSDKAESSICGYGSGVPRASAFKLETAQVNAVDVCDAVVILVVFCFADIDPFFGVGHAVDDQFRESV
jgi:hypothetical protein